MLEARGSVLEAGHKRLEICKRLRNVRSRQGGERRREGVKKIMIRVRRKDDRVRRERREDWDFDQVDEGLTSAELP